MEHTDIPAGQVHVPHQWAFANMAALQAAVVLDSDQINKLALQLDTGAYWRLASVIPTTWTPLGAGALMGMAPSSIAVLSDQPALTLSNAGNGPGLVVDKLVVTQPIAGTVANAVQAQHAGTADAASNAQHAGTADTAGSATEAQHAGAADTAGRATKAGTLDPGAKINGVPFSGAVDITVPAAAGTITGTTLAANVTASSLTSLGALLGIQEVASVNTTATSGTTLTIPAGLVALTLDVPNIPALTVIWPAAPGDQQVVEFTSTGAIAAFTSMPNTGQTMVTPYTAMLLPAGGRVAYRFNAADSKWRAA